MDHQYKNPNQAQAVINNRNQTAPVTDSQDVQTMEYVDQQDVAGNDFVAEQIPAVAGPTSAGGAVSPWDVNLFSQAKPGMQDVEWARDSKSTHDLKGRPRTGTKSLHKESGTLVEGHYGDLDYQNTVRMRYMNGAELSYDGTRVNTQNRSAEVDGITISERARQEYAGGGQYKNSARDGVETSAYIGSKGGSQAVAETAVENGTLRQSVSNQYDVQAKRNNGVNTGSLALGGEKRTRLTTDVDGVERAEERGKSGSFKANVSHTKDAIQGTLGGETGRSRAVEQRQTLDNGSIETIKQTGGQTIGGEIGRDAQGNISLQGSAGTQGGVTRQVESVDAQGRVVKNTQLAQGGAEIKGSHKNSGNRLDGKVYGEVGAAQEVTWNEQEVAHSLKQGATLGGTVQHNINTNKSALETQLKLDRTDQEVENITDQHKQTRTLEQGFTGRGQARLENGALVEGSTGFRGAYDIAHTKADEKQEDTVKTTGTVKNKFGVNGAIDSQQRKMGTTYNHENSQLRTEVIDTGTRSETDKTTVGTAVDHDFQTKKTKLKGDVGYSTGVNNTTQVDASTQQRSGHKHDVNVGGTVALENNGTKVAGTTKKAGYAYTTTSGETVTVDGRTDSVDHTNKTALSASDKGNGVILGADHDYTRATNSSWTQDNEQHQETDKFTVGGGVRENLETEDLDLATRMGYSTGSSVTEQIDENTKQTTGVTHDIAGAVNLDLDDDDKSADDTSIKASYGIGFNNSTEKQTDQGKVTDISSHKLMAKSDWQKDNRNVDATYQYKTGQKVETDTGYKENSDLHKINIGGTEKIERSDEGVKKDLNLKAGYSLSNSEKEMIKNGDETLTNVTTNTFGGDVGYDVTNKKFSTGLRGEHKSEVIAHDGSKIVSKQENSATLDQNGNATLARKTEDVGYELWDKTNDEYWVKTKKDVRSSEINATTQKNEDGTRSFGVGAKVGYSAFKQEHQFIAKSMSKKVSGLRLGDKDVDGQDKVRTLQKSLNKAGHQIEVNGIFDSVTASAVEKFQKENGLAITEQSEITAETAAALPNVKILPEGTKFNATAEAGTASADANVKSTFTAEQIKVEGAAGAKVTMVGGSAKISLPVFNWKLGGESMAVAVTAGVNASVLAEANGNIKMDVGKSDKGINAHIEGGGKAFVGAKAGVEVGAEVQWRRNSAQYYGDLIKQFASSLPGTWDDTLVNKVPAEIWPQLAQVLIGTRTSTIMYARAGAEGQAGLGAEATFNAGIKNGMIEASGSMGGSFGLGGSVKTSVGLHAVDGVRLGGVMAMKGATWLADTLPAAKQWLNSIEEELDKKIDMMLEEKKKQGGFGGFVAGAVDFVGDDLFNLW